MKLPQYRQQVVARQATVGAAPVDTSMSRALGQVAQTAGQFAQAREQMLDREARDYTINAQNQTTVGLEQAKVQLTQESSTGSDYTKGIEDWINDSKQKALDNAPNQRAADLTSEYYNSLLAGEMKNAIPVAAKMNAQNTAAITKEAMQISFNDTMRSPSSYEGNLAKGALIISTSDIPESQKEGAIRAYRNELSYYRFQGMVSDNPVAAKQQLESGDWDANLTPQQMSQLTNAADNQIKSVNASSKQKLTGEIQDYISYKSSGGSDTRNYTEDNLKAVYGEQQGAELYTQIQDVNSFADNYQKVQFASAEDLGPLMESEMVTGPEDFRTQSSQQSTMVKAVNERNKQLTADPAKYVMQSDNVKNSFEVYTQTGDGKQFAATTIAEQKRLGVPSDFTTILTKQQAGQMVSQYQEGDESAAEFVQTLRDQFGDYFPNVMRDLTGAGLSPNAATVAVLPSGSRGSAYLAQADKEGYKAIKETLATDDHKEITTTVMDELGDFDSTSYSVGTRNQVKQSTELLAMKYLSSGVYDNPSDAVKAAANDVVNSRYEYQDTYRVPVERDAYLIEVGVDRLIPSVIDMDLMPPRSATLPPDVALESYKSSLKPKAITLNDDSGVVMYDNQNEPILDSNGNLIIYTWSELEKMAEDDKYLPLRRGR